MENKWLMTAYPFYAKWLIALEAEQIVIMLLVLLQMPADEAFRSLRLCYRSCHLCHDLARQNTALQMTLD